MTTLAIIPARSGSKGFKNKNIKKINNKTLIEIAYEVAKKTKIFTDILISTDSQKYKSILEKKGIFIDTLRSKKFSKDDTSDLELLTYEIKKFEKKKNTKVKYICLLQPTSPIRYVQDIKKCFNLLTSNKLEAVWTISKIDKKFHPIKILTTNNNKLKYFSSGGKNFVNRQSLKDNFIRNGIAYFFTRKSIINLKQILPLNSGFVEISRDIANIDTFQDFKKAKRLLKKIT